VDRQPGVADRILNSSPEGALPASLAEPRQRWRLVFERSPGAPLGAHREVVDGWIARLVEAQLPIGRPSGARPERVRLRPVLAFAAPLPLGMPVERDLADLILTERRQVWDVRQRLESTLPEGFRLHDLHDVWLGAPPLAAAVAAADYRVTLAHGETGSAVRAAAAGLLEATTLSRRREKSGGTVVYDLRPLLADIEVVDGPPPVLRVRTRFHPERGAGRPEEVVAAIAERLGRPLEATATVRERIVLAGDERDEHRAGTGAEIEPLPARRGVDRVV